MIIDKRAEATSARSAASSSSMLSILLQPLPTEVIIWQSGLFRRRPCLRPLGYIKTIAAILIPRAQPFGHKVEGPF